MSKRALVLVSIFFVFSVIFYLSVTRESHEGAENVLRPLGNEDLKEATRIEIYQGSRRNGLVLVKEGNRWVILSDYRKPASERLVEKFLETFANLSGEERARGKKYFDRFGVGEKEGLHVVFKKDGQVLSHFVVGKRGPRWESSFVRLEGQDNIYLVPVNLLALVDIQTEEPAPPKEEAFLNLEVLTLPIEELKELTFESPNISWSLRLEDNKYLFEVNGEKREIPLEEGRKFLRKLFPILAEGVVPPDRFPGPQGVLSYSLRDGRKGRLYLTCQKEDCLLKKDDFVFRVKKETLKVLFSPSFDGEVSE
ncbi:MAG: DUF4340 domain-containing protein [Thermodesulfobacteria bacterium]|nr:DUF4340 domain-containing protein [Thermodesulfobacteriota bacterium]